ncbi:hypothetical protein [uncultured Paracoccus sp.]|uniref:hypothetical protein n=1 Tax=uncultured Paracoccus sp. TaxID=189685 RepID=UPI0025F07209|nr:hypothetical protein [uncultured Paracoccus sp.]
MEISRGLGLALANHVLETGDRMRARQRGHIIINITLIARRAPGAGTSLYAPAKYAMEGFSAARMSGGPRSGRPPLGCSIPVPPMRWADGTRSYFLTL